MMILDRFARFGMGCGLSMAASACLLVSCGDSKSGKDGKKPETPAVAKDAAAAPKVPAPVEAPKPAEKAASQVFAERSVFELADLLRPYTQTPEIHESVRFLNEIAENYLDALKAKKNPTEEDVVLICRVGNKVGDLQAALQAIEKAESSYRDVLERTNALPQEKVETIRLRSGAMRGLGVLLFAKDDSKASLENFRACVDADRKALELLKPAEGELQSPAYHAVAKDLMDSYKNVADMLVNADELEDARDMYQKAVDFALSLKNLSQQDEAALRIKLMHTISALGDLEDKCDQLEKAKNYWLEAATQCQTVYQMTTRPDLKSYVSQAFDKLKARILEAEKTLKGDKPEGEEGKSSDEMKVNDAPSSAA